MQFDEENWENTEADCWPDLIGMKFDGWDGNIINDGLTIDLIKRMKEQLVKLTAPESKPIFKNFGDDIHLFPLPCASEV